MEDNSVASAAPAQEAPEAAENVQESNEQQAQPAAEQKAKNLKKLKLKVDGQEIEEEIDLNDEETIKRHLQMSKAAQKRMSEAAQVRRQAEQFISKLKTDPIAVLNDPSLGLEFRKIAEDFIYKQIELESMSPEQRKLKEYEERLRQHEEEKQRQQQEQESRQMEELKARYAEDYDKKITSALSTSGLPKTARTVKRMAELMHKNLEYGFELEPAQLVEIVREDYLREIKELFGATDGDMLLKLLGDDTANKIRKADLARLKAAKPSFKTEKQAPAEEPKPKKKMTTDEWIAEIRKRAQS